MFPFQSVEAAELASVPAGAKSYIQSVEASELTVGAETDIQKPQCQDSQLVEIIRFVEEGYMARKIRSQFAVVDGVLFYVSPLTPGCLRLAVPLLKEHHAGKFSGHFAEQYIYATLSG